MRKSRDKTHATLLIHCSFIKASLTSHIFNRLGPDWHIYSHFTTHYLDLDTNYNLQLKLKVKSYLLFLRFCNCNVKRTLFSFPKRNSVEIFLCMCRLRFAQTLRLRDTLVEPVCNGSVRPLLSSFFKNTNNEWNGATNFRILINWIFPRFVRRYFKRYHFWYTQHTYINIAIPRSFSAQF